MGRILVTWCQCRCLLAGCILWGTVGVTSLAAQQAAPNGYRIGAGDVLQILVWKEPDASLPETMVQADGKITVPLIGEVAVDGMTLSELQTCLAGKFSRFIHGPVVTVHAKQINSRKVYVMGHVKREGPLLLLRPMTVLQAINEAGGFLDFAKRRKIYVMRKVDGKQVRLPFDYQSVIKGQHQEQNIPLLLDDTIIVP